jgi:hypothetical protein
MRCPHCQSRHVRSFAVVFNQNLRVGRFLTTNALGLKCAPPRRRPLVPWITACLLLTPVGVVAIVLGRVVAEARPTPAVTTLTHLFWRGFPCTLAPAVLLLAWLAWIAAAVRYNRVEYPVRHEAWRHRWLCMDCGATVPGPAATE